MHLKAVIQLLHNSCVGNIVDMERLLCNVDGKPEPLQITSVHLNALVPIQANESPKC